MGAKWFLDNGGYYTCTAGTTVRSLIARCRACCSATTRTGIRTTCPIVARQGRTRREAGLRVPAGSDEELPGAPTGDQHRLGHRPGHARPIPGSGIPCCANFFPSPARCPSPEHPRPGTAGARPGPYPGCTRHTAAPDVRAASGTTASTPGVRPTHRRPLAPRRHLTIDAIRGTR